MQSRLPANFTSLTASEKLSTHIRMMQNTKYITLPTLNPNASSLLKLFNREALAESFLNDSDERKPDIQGSIKPIHTQGVSVPIVYSPSSTNYTGLFASGGVGILRLSEAVNSKPWTYGMGMKILIDGKPSVNFHAMFSLDGQGDDTNFFSNSFTTHVESPQRTLLKILAYSFHRALPFISKNPNNRPNDETFIPLIEAASIGSNGTVEENPVAPTKIIFAPRVSINSKNGNDFRSEIIDQVQPESIIYDMFDENNVVLGTIRSTSQFIASSYGDDMFFKHQKISKIPTKSGKCQDCNCPVVGKL